MVKCPEGIEGDRDMQGSSASELAATRLARELAASQLACELAATRLASEETEQSGAQRKTKKRENKSGFKTTKRRRTG